MNRSFQFYERSRHLIGAHHEALSVVAVRVCNPDCASVTIQCSDIALTPTGFVEIVRDGFPVLHTPGCCLLIVQNRLRRGFAYLKLCAHFLHLPLQFSNGGLEIFMLPRNRGF